MASSFTAVLSGQLVQVLFMAKMASEVWRVFLILKKHEVGFCGMLMVILAWGLGPEGVCRDVRGGGGRT